MKFRSNGGKINKVIVVSLRLNLTILRSLIFASILGIIFLILPSCTPKAIVKQPQPTTNKESFEKGYLECDKECIELQKKYVAHIQDLERKIAHLEERYKTLGLKPPVKQTYERNREPDKNPK